MQGSQWLDRAITLEEVEYALKISGPDKAPWPDGFNMGCVKKLWRSLKSKILTCLEDFLVRGNFSKGLKSSFIALIPKVAQPKLVTDFRPISLINYFPKLFIKLLAERLGLVIGK